MVNGQCQLVSHTLTCCTSLPTPTPPPPPTLTLEFQCSLWGLGGWCRDGGQLKAVGTDPSGGTITVSGSLNDPANTPIACQGTGSCTAIVPLPEGLGTAQATATSRYGKAQASMDWLYDPTYPALQFTLAPSSPDGQNGWYITAPTVTLQGSDATSGIASLEISPDGATWYPSPWTVPDGQYNLILRAMDRAGNITQTQTALQVDTTPPQVLYQIPPPDGLDGWHISPVTVQVSGQDATSGVAAAQVAVDGGAWQDHTVTLSADGIYQLTFQALDAAGNQTTAGPVTLKMDLTPPLVTWGSAWDRDQGCTPSLTGIVTDATSGVVGAAFSWDDGATWLPLDLDAQGHWAIQPDVRAWNDGDYQALVQAWDAAGLQTTSQHTLTVSNPAPHIVVEPLRTDARWMFWETLRYEVRTTCLPIAKMRIVVEGPDVNRTVTWDTSTWPGPSVDGSTPATYAVSWRWDTRWDGGAYAHPGEYPVRFEAWDVWGRKWMEFGTLVVPVMSGPSPTPEALPSPTATPTAGPTTPTPTALAAGFVPPTLPAGGSGGLLGPSPTPLPPAATATPRPTSTPIAEHTGLVGSAPPWAKKVAVGTLFAGLLAALTAAYYRRKLADWRARLSAYKASKETDDTPLPRETHLLIDGEVPLEDAAEGRVPQPGPPKPDGSFDPFRGRGLWGNEHGPVTSTPKSVDLAAWKQQDYQGVAAYQAAMRADEAFNAEVGVDSTPSSQLGKVHLGKMAQWEQASNVPWSPHPGEKFIEISPIVLRGGVESESYAERAESGYTGHSLGGVGEVPLANIPELINLALVWLRDATPFLDKLMRRGWLRSSVQAAIFYRQDTIPLSPDTFTLSPVSPPDQFSIPPSIRSIPVGPVKGVQESLCEIRITLTAVQVYNTSTHPLTVTSIYVDDAQVYPPQETALIPRYVEAGEALRLNIMPTIIKGGGEAKVQIFVREEGTGRFGVLEQTIVVP